jgi:heparin binding hemagglutinin HbhA
MAITDDLRKTLSDPTPLYFAAGTADLALQQAKKVPGLVEQIRAEAPARIEAVRGTDPKAVQEKAQLRAKEAQESIQAKVGELFGTIDGDFRKLGETAQDLALRGVGVAAEYAVRARETYEKVAEHGEQTVRGWRGGAAEEIEDLAIVVEPNTPAKPEAAAPAPAEAPVEAASEAPAAVRKPAAKKTPTRKSSGARKTPPSAE